MSAKPGSRRPSSPSGTSKRDSVSTLIAFRDGAAGRRPGLVGSRLDVWQVVETVKQNGSVEEAAAYLELPVEKVQAAMRYYADYTDEIDEWASRANALAEREQALSRLSDDIEVISS